MKIKTIIFYLFFVKKQPKSSTRKDFNNPEFLEVRCTLLREFYKEYGHCRVPVDSYRVDNINLGRWVAGMRTQHQKGNLPEKVVKKLESVKGWVWRAKGLSEEETFQKHLESLQNFIDINGSLETWNSDLRKHFNYFYSRKKSGTLSVKNIKALESLPGWSWQTSRFNRYIVALKEYVEEFGNTLVPKSFRTADGRPLGIWVSRQRTYYRRKLLSEDKIFKLQQIPCWIWSRKSTDWEDYYHTVRNDSLLHGFRIKKSTVIDDLNVGQWVYRQRTSYRNGKLSKDKVSLLESIPGWWWSKITNHKS